MKNLRDGNRADRGKEGEGNGGTSHPIAMRRKEGEGDAANAQLFTSAIGDGRPRNTQCGGGRRTRAFTQPRVKIGGGGTKDDTLQLHDLTRGRKEGRKEMAARDRIRPECERRPRLLASYKNCLSCRSCLLTHSLRSDPKEGREEGGRSTQKGGTHSEGRRRALSLSLSAVSLLWCLWYHCMQRNDPLQKETATQWGRRGGEERY